MSLEVLYDVVLSVCLGLLVPGTIASRLGFAAAW
jgi:hypothetical protein